MITDYNRLSGLQKVAILFSVLGESLAMTLIKGISQTDLRRVRATIRELGSVSFTVKKRVIEEFYFSFISEKFQETGDEPKRPFGFMDPLTDEQVVALLVSESPRVIAIAMAQLPQSRRMLVLGRLDAETKGRVLIEMGNLVDIPLEGVVDVARDLEDKSHFLPRTVNFSRGGGKDIADILGEMDPEDERKYLEAITNEDPDLARAVKKHYLTFEDIFEIFPDGLLRDLMNSVELDTIAMAMKGMDEDIVNHVLESLPQKKQAMFEPVEGAVAKREIDKARKTIVQAARQMEKAGEYKLEDLAGGSVMIE